MARRWSSHIRGTGAFTAPGGGFFDGAQMAVPAAIIEVSYTTGAYGSAPLPPLPPPMSAVQKRALSSPPRHKKALCSPPRGPRRRCNDDHESAAEDLHSPIEPPWRRCKDDHEGAEEDEQ